MKYVTVKLTKDQAHMLANALSWAMFEDNGGLIPSEKRFNAFCRRIKLKVLDQLQNEIS